MIKKILLINLLLNTSWSLQASEDSSFWRFLAYLIGSSAQYDTQHRSSANTGTTTYNNAARLKCACGETMSSRVMIRGCCGAQICKSCLNARRDTAIRNHKNLLCNCGRIIEDFSVAPQVAALNDAKYAPTAPPVVGYNNQVNMCASGCNTAGQIRLLCHGRHVMCASCLRSRVANAVKNAGGAQPYVTCPKCKDMLTLDVIRQTSN